MTTQTQRPPSYVNGDSCMAVLGRPVIVPRADALRLHNEGTALLDGAHGPWQDECEPTYAFGSTMLTESEALWLANAYAADDAATEREWSPFNRASVDIDYGTERAHAAVIGTMRDPNEGQRTKPRKRASDPRERVERQVQRSKRPTTTLATLTTERFDDARTSYRQAPRIPVPNGSYCIGTYLLVDGDAVTVVETRQRATRQPTCKCDQCPKCKSRARVRKYRERERELRALLKDAAAEQDAKLANARDDAKRAKRDAVATSATGWAERD